MSAPVQRCRVREIGEREREREREGGKGERERGGEHQWTNGLDQILQTTIRSL